MNSPCWRTLVSATELHRDLHSGAVVVIDCRFDLRDPRAGHAAWQAAHIPGAHYADLEQNLSGPVNAQSGRHPLPDIATLSTAFSNRGIDDDTQVIAYDADNGSMAATRLWWLLRWLGHERVAVLDGGFKTWLAAGLPVSNMPAASSSRRFIAHPHHDWVLSTADVRNRLHKAGWRIVDARAPERYAGEVEPIDPVAGHIPGAINYPLTNNLDSDGRFLSAAELRRQWQTVLGEADAAHVISSCGSGVTACHNLLALEIAGFSGGKLYAGSWSEWCKQPGYPISTGPDPR